MSRTIMEGENKGNQISVLDDGEDFEGREADTGEG